MPASSFSRGRIRTWTVPRWTAHDQPSAKLTAKEQSFKLRDPEAVSRRRVHPPQSRRRALAHAGANLLGAAVQCLRASSAPPSSACHRESDAGRSDGARRPPPPDAPDQACGSPKASAPPRQSRVDRGPDSGRNGRPRIYWMRIVQGPLAHPLPGWHGQTGSGPCSAWNGRGRIHRLLLTVRQPPGDTGPRQSRGAVHAPRAQR